MALDLRKELAGADLLQVLSILVCVVAFGYVVGFLAGLLASCIFFVVNYARMPHIRLDTTLASVRSSVIRDVTDQQYLTAAGAACRIGRFEASSSSAWPTRSTSGTALPIRSSPRCWCSISPRRAASTRQRWR